MEQRLQFEKLYTHNKGSSEATGFMSPNSKMRVNHALSMSQKTLEYCQQLKADKQKIE